ADVGLRVDHVFGETDVAVMHGYPMYSSWSAGPLDPWFVPFTCALTTALCGLPTLAEEFGGCTAPAGERSQVWRWTAYGKQREQFMASEEDFAAYLEQVLVNLAHSGSTGAMLWCWSDYVQELWDRPPCDESRHERHFGLVRADGSEKPHVDVVRRFAATAPTVADTAVPVQLDLATDEYHADPQHHAARLYRRWREQVSGETWPGETTVRGPS
ncbi:MAG: hypothetical protein AAFP84_15065, partial [Actinomycetota bacterium]